jgi:signal transduction histidine kinase
MLILSTIGSIVGAPLYALLATLTLTYGLSRTRYYNLAGVVALLAFSYPSFSSIIMVGDQVTSYLLAIGFAWLVLPIVLSSLILPAWGTAMIAGVNIAGILVVKISIMPQLPDNIVFSSLGYILTISVVLIVSTAVRQHYLIEPQFQELRDIQSELERSNRELAAANKEIRDFAYIVAHDLRAPLVNISGFLNELMYVYEKAQTVIQDSISALSPQQRTWIEEKLNQDVPEALHFIESSADTMDVLIKEILQLSRAGRQVLHLQSIELEPFARHILDARQHDVEAAGVEIQIESLPEVIADPTALEQIIANLLDNALKYLDPERTGKIRIYGEVADGQTIVNIEDNGIGIAQSDQEKIFQPFRRASNVGHTQGQGIGLTYVQAMVQKHGGRIWFTTALNKGSTFSFSLPNDHRERITL